MYNLIEYYFYLDANSVSDANKSFKRATSLPDINMNRKRDCVLSLNADKYKAFQFKRINCYKIINTGILSQRPSFAYKLCWTFCLN